MNPVCLAVGLGLAGAAGATAATAPPVQLSARDQGLIAGMACMPVALL